MPNVQSSGLILVNVNLTVRKPLAVSIATPINI